MDLGDRLIKLANKLLSAGSSETLGTQGGITNATANDILVPTSKAVKDYVDGKTIELITTTNTSDEELAATSTTLSEVKDGTMILLKIINPFNTMRADSRLTLTLKNGEVLNRKLMKHPDFANYLPSNIVPSNTIFLMRYHDSIWFIIDQYNLATQSFRGFMSAEDKTKLDNTYTKAEIDELNTSKVDKVTGKGLSSNDFTDEYKKLLDNIPIANVTLRWGSQAGGIGGYKIIGISSFILQEEFEVAGGSQGRLPPGTSMAFDCMEDNVSVPLPDGLIDLIKNRYSSLTFSHSDISLSITGTGDNRELVIKNNGSSNIDYWNVKYSK